MYRGERFNAYTHLGGTLLAVTGTVLLLAKAADAQDAYKITSAAAYGACLIVLYLGSTVYHSVRRPSAKNMLQKLDHCAIYLLIAGSYTPFTLVTLRGAWGWSLFGVSWGLAAFGIAQELTIGRKSEKRLLSMILYVVMGWLVLGGLLYSGGIYWFINDEKIKYGHGIWHLFVLGGSLAQFICVYVYVV